MKVLAELLEIRRPHVYKIHFKGKLRQGEEFLKVLQEILDVQKFLHVMEELLEME